MSKLDEINYIDKVVCVSGIDRDAFDDYLFRKPYSDVKCSEYLADISQILQFLPPSPAKILDLGCGSGWSTEIFAKCGYQAIGLDIADDCIAMARRRPNYDGRLTFHKHDFENALQETDFDAVVIYDALHHADNEVKVLQQAFMAIKDGGVMLILEPGVGHAQSAGSLSAMAKYGTTEKDMPFSYYKPLLLDIGFRSVTQYLRIRQLPIVDISSAVGPYHQIQNLTGLCFETASNGLSSLGVARK